MNAPLYTTEILRLAASLQAPHDLGRVDGRAELRSPTCGSRIAVAVELDGDRRVRAISQTVHACAFGQASAALLERRAAGFDHAAASAVVVQLSRWLSAESDDVGDWAELSALAPARKRQARHGAILLPWRALVAAIESCQ